MNTTKNNFIRNIAMIGHVSHDKNTLLIQNRKVTYGDYKINFIDIFDSTDFDGKVEHTLQMVEGFLLFIDASEDVLPETRFVLRKALKFKLKPIVVINKTNKKDVAIDALESSIHDLFLDFAIDTDQLDFPILYTLDKNKIDENLKQLFETIIFFISAPTSRTDLLDNAYVPINEPTMTIFLSVNDSPFSGREGTLLTACQIKDRLDKESKTNKTLKIESTNYPELFKISGPNVLHFTALIENMRQEGFEL